MKKFEICIWMKISVYEVDEFLMQFFGGVRPFCNLFFFFDEFMMHVQYAV